MRTAARGTVPPRKPAGTGRTWSRPRPDAAGSSQPAQAAADGKWLLFLHADTHPASGWDEEVGAFIAVPANQGRAACFRFALDDPAIAARLLERLVALRCRLLALPYGDQGLLMHRSLYEALGGFRPLPMMEDVDLVRRLGRRRLAYLRTPAVTSAVRFRRVGLRAAHGAQSLLPAALLARRAGRDGGEALRMRPGERHLAIFLKEPRLGRAKARLARDIGHGEAWLFYRRLVRSVLPPLARDPRWRAWLATTPDGWRGREPFWPVALPCLPQGPGNVGQRMLRVFRRLPPGPAIVVGSDIPDLAPIHVARGFAALGSADMVLGPAEDGGYWLIGLSARARRIDPFQGVRWSSPRALADTARALPAGYRVALVDRLADVDDGPAYLRWRAQVNVDIGPRTQASDSSSMRAQASDSSDMRTQASATHSISMSNSMGQDAMATKVLAGGS